MVCADCAFGRSGYYIRLHSSVGQGCGMGRHPSIREHVLKIRFAVPGSNRKLRVRVTAETEGGGYAHWLERLAGHGFGSYHSTWQSVLNLFLEDHVHAASSTPIPLRPKPTHTDGCADHDDDHEKCEGPKRRKEQQLMV